MHVLTPRLEIRGWRDGDRPALAQMVGDPAMMRYVTGGRVWGDAEVDVFLARQEQQLARDRHCLGALCLRDGGGVIGMAGVQRLDRLDAWDAGWWVWREHWGRGYATEAAHALVQHALLKLGLGSVYAVVDPGNAASVRVAEKAGMRNVGEATADRTASWRDAAPVWLYRADA